MTSARITIGLMSGTSLDGVDAVAVSFDGELMKEVGHAYVPFELAFREELHSLCTAGANEIERCGVAGVALSRYYAQVVEDLLSKHGLDRSAIAALGAHGQTLRHRPQKGFTYQLLAPALLAELTGIDVICDFRSRDIAAGGEGAPLVPAFHAQRFSSDQPRAILNIGGIANLSLLPSRARQSTDPIRGGDTGPGNVLLNRWCERHIGALYDQNGDWAKSGRLCEPLLAHFLADPYFARPFPKSTGRELFSEAWLTDHLRDFKAINPADVANTLTELTARSITDALKREAPQIKELYFCGGGAFNRFMMSRLQANFSGLVVSTNALGIRPDHVEGAAFAWLAHQFLEGQSANLPSVTHAQGPRRLGALYPH